VHWLSFEVLMLPQSQLALLVIMEGKYHSYVRVIYIGLQNGLCVLVLVLVLAEVVNDLPVNFKILIAL